MVSVLIFIVLTFAGVSWCQRIPNNPCPSVFSYLREVDYYYGEVTIPYDGSQQFSFEVNVSMIGLYSQEPKLRLTLLTPTDRIDSSSTLQYRIDFPFPKLIIPKITRIKYNARTLCKGPPEPLTENGVTNLWSSLYHQINQYTFMVGGNGSPITIDMRPAQRPANPFNPFLNPSSPQESYPSTGPPPSRTPTLEDVCGRADDVQTLVVKGENTRDGEFPWLVAMFHNQDFRCTANLISAQHVITAGHCVWINKAPLIDKKDILLILGAWEISKGVGSNALIRSAVEVTPHPEYTQNKGHGDIAIIKMNEPVTFRPTIRPICMWKGDNNLKSMIGTMGVVAGWGLTGNGEVADQPQKTSMPIVAQETCLRSHQDFSKLTSEKTFCAGNRNGEGPCSGDSGAGFMIKKNRRWYLRGIVSTAITNQDRSCNLNEYVVFADVAKLNDWVKSKIG